MKQPAFYLVTLGCKVNQYESHALREAWLANGLREAFAPEAATHVVVNSCAVTAKAVADVRNTVRRIHRAAPKAAIILTGCAAQSVANELQNLQGVVAVVGQSGKATLLQGNLAVFSASGTATAVPLAENTQEQRAFPPFAVSGYDRSRAVLKIQDGCSHRCTYCIVPLSRGKAVSRPAKDSLAEVERLLHAGFREITISGVNLRQYRGADVTNARDITNADGSNAGGIANTPASHDFWDFIALLEKHFAANWAGKARFRISSLEPGQLGEKALTTLRASTLIAPHLHLSLQSGSVSVLERMGRGHYDPATVVDFLESLIDVWPCFGLGADILTGFPGETDAEHAQSMRLCEALPFSYAHVFPFSKRPGTAAAAMPHQVESGVKKQRAAELRTLVAAHKKNFLHRQLALPLLFVALEGSVYATATATTAATVTTKPTPLHGTNEFYSECRFEAPASANILKHFPVDGASTATYRPANITAFPRTLIPARPVRVEKDTLIVAPLLP